MSRLFLNEMFGGNYADRGNQQYKLNYIYHHEKPQAMKKLKVSRLFLPVVSGCLIY